MKLNLDYYKPENDFGLKKGEEKVIEYIYANKEKDYENIVKKDLCDDVILGLSQIRENLVKSYDFVHDSIVLEIGAHLGENTGALCEKCAKVVSTDISKKRAEAIAKRYENNDNLEIIVGRPQEIKFEEKFDYITLFGVLEFAQNIFETEDPALDLIMYCKSLLKENGKLLIATDNKFALKSYVGDFDKCTGITFDSITGYKSSKKTYKLGKKSIKDILSKAGLINYKFFYPLPDYKLPSSIFTDEYLPSSSKINGYFPYYKENSSVFYSEVDAYDAIIKEDKKMFPFFANSYFIVASQEEFKDDTRYVSFNNYRKEEYQLMTKIREKVVEKTSINDKAKEHLKSMINNIENLKKENIEILDEAENNKVISKFVNIKLASQLVSDNVKNPEEILRILNKYKEELLKISVDYNEKERTVLEKYIPNVDKSILSKFKYLSNGYWDMILKNCFIIDGNCVFFDQEWVEENVPMEFLIYRSIMNVEKLRSKIDEYKIFEKMGIEKYITLFEELDGKITEEIIDKDIFGFFQRKHANPIYENYYLREEKRKLEQENEELKEEKEKIIQEQKMIQKNLEKQNDEMKRKLEGIYDSRSWKIAKKITGIKNSLKNRKETK